MTISKSVCYICNIIRYSNWNLFYSEAPYWRRIITFCSGYANTNMIVLKQTGSSKQWCILLQKCDIMSVNKQSLHDFKVWLYMDTRYVALLEDMKHPFWCKSPHISVSQLSLIYVFCPYSLHFPPKNERWK